MPDITSDDIHEHLIRKISNQAAQLGLLNNDLCDAAEYVKICECKLIEFENAVVANSKQSEIYERTNRSNEDAISRLQQNVTIKDGNLVAQQKEIADHKREIQKLRVQLKTAQHSLRFASQTPNPVDNSSQSRSKSEVILLKANLKLYKDQAESAKTSELAMRSRILALEKIVEDHSMCSSNLRKGERLNDRKDSASAVSGRGRDLSNNHSDKAITFSDISERDTDRDRDRDRSSGGMMETETRSMTAVERLIKSSQNELLEAQKELNTMQMSELSRQLKTVEEARDTLLQYIQTDLTETSSLKTQLEQCQLDLSNCSGTIHETEERAALMERKFEDELARADSTAAELKESRSLISSMEENYRNENVEKSNEAKKGAYIINVLTSELKSARARVSELEASVAEGEERLLKEVESAKVAEQSRKQGVGAQPSDFDDRVRERNASRRSDPSRLLDRALADLAADLKAIAASPTESGTGGGSGGGGGNMQRQRSISFAVQRGSTPSRQDFKSASMPQTGRRSAMLKDGKGHTDRSYSQGRGASASVVTGYPRSSSPGSRSPSRARIGGPSSVIDGSSPCYCPLSEEHSLWTDLPSLHRALPDLGDLIKKMATDLYSTESQLEVLQDRYSTILDKYDTVVEESNAERFDFTVVNKALNSDLCDVRGKLEEAEARLETEHGSSNILDQTVIALLDAPGGWEKYLDDRLLNSLHADNSSLSGKQIAESIALSDSSDGTGISKKTSHPAETRGNAGASGSGNTGGSSNDEAPPRGNSRSHSRSRSPSPRSALDQFKPQEGQRYKGDGSKNLSGPLWMGGVGAAPAAFRVRVPEVVSRVVAVAGLALSRARQAEDLLVTALSDLKTHQSALRISKGEYEYMSMKYEESKSKSRDMGDSFLEMETNLMNGLRAATDLAEQQNLLIEASDAKVQMLVREKHLLNAQLTVARQTESVESGISKIQDPQLDRTLGQSTVQEYAPIQIVHSTVPHNQSHSQSQSLRRQINSSGHTKGSHPSVPRGDASSISRMQGPPVEPYDRSVLEDVPARFPTKVGQQPAAERHPNRADPVYQSRAELEGRWSGRQTQTQTQTQSQRSGPPQSSSSFYSCVEESIPDLNASSRGSFGSDSMLRSKVLRDTDREGLTEERMMTSSEFVRYVKARRKIYQ